jgi:glycosyltransferase involved in cell wall biosynthesis
MTKLILLTMVKNESRIIERLMESVKGKVDAIIVCDTGSTDNTKELAISWMKKNGVKGDVYEYPFVNFGKSRTKSFECCQDWVKMVGWDSRECWALLLDGDMRLTGELSKEKLSKLPLNVAGVSLKQENGTLIYNNMRLLRCSEGWICKGATHEAWTCPPDRTTVNLDQPVLQDIGDGGCKSDKYTRDLRLLKEDLEEMPNDARTHFYLAQTYMCMGDWQNAIPVLKKRIELGGWDEENYIARVYLGDCLKSGKREEEAISTWLDAWEYRQHRTEAPMRLIKLYREKPKSQYIAMMFLEKFIEKQFGEIFRTGEKVGEPVVNNDLLFVNHRDMEHSLWEEMLILSFYTGHGRQSWLRFDGYDLNNRLNWHEFNGLYGHVHWYDWCLKPERNTRFNIPILQLPWANEPDCGVWQPFNPSIKIASDGESYDLNLRYANYYTMEAKNYHYRGFHGQVLTRNCLTKILDSESEKIQWNSPVSAEEILIDPIHKQDEGSYIRGVEDCRLVVNSDKYEFLGTSKSYADNGINKIFHCVRNELTNKWNIRQLPLPSGVSPEICQKNWLGFRNDSGELNYIYSFSPFRICNEEGKDILVSDCGLKEYRGSAGPVKWSSDEYTEERYLCVIHKVYIGGDGRRYYHRFMTLDKDMKPSRVSCWVRMTKEKVEYWSSLCQSISGNKYFITYGLKDSEGWVAEMKKGDIEKVLMYKLGEKGYFEGIGTMKNRLDRI